MSAVAELLTLLETVWLHPLFPPAAFAAACSVLGLLFERARGHGRRCPLRRGFPSGARISSGGRMEVPPDGRWLAAAERVGRVGERAVAAELARLGLPALHDVVLVSGRGSTQVDHVVRLAGAVVVIETKTWSGVIEGGLDGAGWLQRSRDGGVRTLGNPLEQNRGHVDAVRRAVRDRVPVVGVVVSAGRGRFRGASGEAVVPLAVLAQGLRSVDAGGGWWRRRCMEAAWRRLRAAAVSGEGLREAHLRRVRRGAGPF